MKNSTKYTDAIHTMVMIYLSTKDDNIDCSSYGFAKSINTNPAFVRQLMGPLKKAGLITSIPGHIMPSLSKEPRDISLYEIYEALEGDKNILRVGTHPNPECGIGVNIQYSIQDLYNDLSSQIMNQLKEISLQDIIDDFSSRFD